MNKTVEKRLSWLKNKTESIMETCKVLLDDIQDVIDMDDLMLIESNFEKIQRQAKDGYEYSRDTWDEFEEQ